jgi:hypothetical protein
MAVCRLTMTDEQRKSVALEYLKAFDHKGVTSSGSSILDLFADDAQVFFPKWGLATASIGTALGAQVSRTRGDGATYSKCGRPRRLEADGLTGRCTV